MKVIIRDEDFHKVTTQKIKRFEVEALTAARQQVT